jgi:hypothetical protein
MGGQKVFATKSIIRILAFISLVSALATAGTIGAISPANGASVTVPFSVKFTYSGTASYTKLWIDGKAIVAQDNTSTFNYSVTSLATGSHVLALQAHDASNNTTYTSDVSIKVVAASTKSGTSTGTSTSSTSSSPDGYPLPPSNAIVYADAQNTKNTGSCNTASCAGGSDSGASWIAFNQTSPSLSGSSAEVYNSGSGFDTLWYWHLGANNAVTNIELDFYLMVDEGSLTTTQAIENGPQQYVGGYKYSMTMQCEYANQIWRVWDQAAKGWKATTVACPKWTPNVWHHVQMYITTDHTNHTETYQTLVVDGVSHALGITYGVTNVGFGDNLGFQFQLDNNGTGGAVHEWIDNVIFTVW